MFHSARPLLGPHAELRAIDGLRAAARDELSGALLTGDPGIGKARLQIIPRKAQRFMTPARWIARHRDPRLPRRGAEPPSCRSLNRSTAPHPHVTGRLADTAGA